MNRVLKVMSGGLCVLGLSACMSEEGGEEPVLSNGILTLEVPDQATYDELPANMQTLVDNVVASNTSANTASQPSSGDTSYSGTFGMIIDGGPLATGTAELNVDGSANIDYDFTVTSFSGDDDPNATVTGTFGGSSTVSGGYFSGGLSGTLQYDADGAGGSPAADVTVGGGIDGAFDADSDGFGAITGTLGADDTPYTGLFHTTLDP